MFKFSQYPLLFAVALVLTLSPAHLAAAVRSVSVGDLIVQGSGMSGMQVEAKGFVTYTGQSAVDLFQSADRSGGSVILQLGDAPPAARQYLYTNCSQTPAQLVAAGFKLKCAVYVVGQVEVFAGTILVNVKAVSGVPTASAAGPAGSSGEPSGDVSCLVGAQFGAPELNAARAHARDRAEGQGKDETISQSMDRSHHAAFQRAYDKQVGILRGAGTVSGTPPSSGITQTPLSCLFARHPFQGMGTEWPRVAITILSAPSEWGELVRTRDMPPNTCWSMKAKIWYNQMDSEDVPPFQWCWGEMSLGVSFEYVPVWGGRAQFNMMNSSRAGKRTDGPASPSAQLPDDPINKEKFSFMTYSNYFVGSVLHRMALDWNKGDGRVWFNLGF